MAVLANTSGVNTGDQDLSPYISGTGVTGQVAEFVTDTKTLQAAKLIAPTTNILTLTNAAASTLAINITAGKTLTLTAADNYTLTIPATGTAALLGTANVFTLTNTFGAVRIGTPYNSNIQNTYTMPTAAWTPVATGTVSTSGTTITGSGTTFLTDYKVGDAIGVDNLSGAPTPAYHGYITAIASNTSMTTDRFWVTTSGSAHRRLSPVFQIVSASNVPLFTVDSFGQIAYGGTNSNYIGTASNTSANQLVFTSTATSSTAIQFGGGRGSLRYDNTSFSGFKNVCIFYGNSGSLMIREDSQYIYLQAQLGIIQLPVTDARQLTVSGHTTQTLAPVLFYDNTAATNTVRNVLQLETQSTGTAANGLGAGLLYSLETATSGTMQTAGQISASWVDATNATRKAKLSLSAYDTAARLGLEIEASGTEPKIGFYGVAPIARAVLATGAGASVDDVITALQNLGLVKQS